MFVRPFFYHIEEGLAANRICSENPVQHARLRSFHWNVSRGTLRAEQKNRVSADFVDLYGFL